MNSMSMHALGSLNPMADHFSYLKKNNFLKLKTLHISVLAHHSHYNYRWLDKNKSLTSFLVP